MTVGIFKTLFVDGQVDQDRPVLAPPRSAGGGALFKERGKKEGSGENNTCLHGQDCVSRSECCNLIKLMVTTFNNSNNLLGL